MGGPRWTRQEDRVVDWHWGEERLSVTAARVGRSIVAVRQRLITRGEPSSAVRGRQTIQDVAEATGYSWHDIERGIRGSGIRPVRTGDTPRGRIHLMSEEQVARVLEHLDDDGYRSVASCARAAGRCMRTAYHWVRILALELHPKRRGLAAADAGTLVEALRTAPAQPPLRSRLTVAAVARTAGRSRSFAYATARRLGVVAGSDATLSQSDADLLRSCLEVQ